MPIEVKVGPPLLVINQGSTFMATDQRGEIDLESDQGVFVSDTRFVSSYKLYINLRPWELVASSPLTHYAARVHLTNPAIVTEDGKIAPHSLSLVITRTVGDGIHEDLEITNYAGHPVRFMLEIALRSDFADIFEVKDRRFVRRGHIVTRWDAARGELSNTYEHGDFRRALVYRAVSEGARPLYDNGRVVFEIALAPNATWHGCADFIFVLGEREHRPVRQCHSHLRRDTELDLLHEEWKSYCTQVDSTNWELCRTLEQSLEDLGSLRLHEHDYRREIWLPAAGVPWFVTVFGRDSIIVSLQCMSVYPAFALGTLKKLAEFQAREMDDWRDAEPGKILHEVRFGELAHLGRIPTPYYGTADATTLYLVLLHEAWKWLGDEGLPREHRETALRCLEWADRYGDLDGDGFQEYRSRSPKGYENMGWKDSGDAVVYPDGSQVPQPKALCELQGYLFDARLRMAELFDALGEPDRAASLRRQALELQQRFQRAFWCEEMGFYAFALDPDKRPVRTVASNPGHLLWSGIVPPECAPKVAARLMAEDMWSGWGIRTLSSANPAYNPISYQRGSVWPHDNGIIALGLKRYGLVEEANRVAEGIFAAARHFDSYRLPELFAGLPREPGTFPVPYTRANVPQAWAAGSVFHLLQAILGLRADAPRGRLYVHPTLPEWLPDVEVRQLRVGEARLALRFWRDGGRSRWEVLRRDGDLEVVEEPWSPPRLAPEG